MLHVSMCQSWRAVDLKGCWFNRLKAQCVGSSDKLRLNIPRLSPCLSSLGYCWKMADFARPVDVKVSF